MVFFFCLPSLFHKERKKKSYYVFLFERFNNSLFFFCCYNCPHLNNLCLNDDLRQFLILVSFDDYICSLYNDNTFHFIIHEPILVVIDNLHNNIMGGCISPISKQETLSVTNATIQNIETPKPQPEADKPAKLQLAQVNSSTANKSKTVTNDDIRNSGSIHLADETIDDGDISRQRNYTLSSHLTQNQSNSNIHQSLKNNTSNHRENKLSITLDNCNPMEIVNADNKEIVEPTPF
ncbi:hypothetical protein RFI_18269, partial [Reticulomyxa filosa]